jgi:hypothetical protein
MVCVQQAVPTTTGRRIVRVLDTEKKAIREACECISRHVEEIPIV